MTLCVACLLGMAGGLMSGDAWAGQTIDNTASVSFRLQAGRSDTVMLKSNTVRIDVLPTPTPAVLQFLRYDPDAPQGEAVPVDGGQCRLSDGAYAPLPPVHDTSGAQIDPASTGTEAAPGYYTGEPVVLTIGDPNRNEDPASREFVEVELATTTGDAEVLRLIETGPDTGVFAGAIQSVPMPPAAVQHDCSLSLAAYAELNARYTDSDFPLDALAVAAASYAPLPPQKVVLRLAQTVSKQIVEIGDHLQYTLVVSNIHDGTAYATRVSNTLPPGFRYEPGSLRVGGIAMPDSPDVVPAALGSGDRSPATATTQAPRAAVDPGLVVNGRSFEFPVGDLAPGASVTATFIASVGPGAVGQTLVNKAIARASGSVVSNWTDTVVRMRDSMNSSRLTIIGRITAGACDAADGAPVQGVRVVMEDGTFTSTDAAGAYHIEGVRPGTHVVQIDLATLPPDLEIAPCNRSTRHAGRGYSQFVEAQGGMLWRADFRLQRKQVEPIAAEVGAVLRASRQGDALRIAMELDGNAGNVTRVRPTIAFPEGSRYVAGSATLDGAAVPDPQVRDGMATFDLGDPGQRWRRTLEFTLDAGVCPATGYTTTGMLMIDATTAARSPPLRLNLPCDSPPDGTASPRTAIPIAADPDAGPAASPSLASVNSRPVVVSDQAADGDRDWFAGQAPGREFLFPTVGHNPRAPAIRVVVKSMPGDTVALRLNGQPVSPLNFAGNDTDGANTITLGTWTGVDIGGGDNLLQADITDRQGNVTTIERVVHFASSVARAELVPEKSYLVADGIQSPVIAVRMMDASGHPVRKEVTGTFTINPPYTPAQTAAALQARQLAGDEGYPRTWKIEGDDGIAYITLEPTGTAGSVELGFDFRAGGTLGGAHQDIKAWLKSAPRDWIVVGFAAGSVGYETLKDNMQALAPDEDGSGLRGDGRVSLYAKGRVLGKWMLTLAYDTGKPTDELRNRSLLSVIDPGQYYTLYGDGSFQGYDAASARKLYLKLERDQFHALFGDFQTGLDRAELSRYQRALTGIKVAYRGPLVEFSGFAARTAQNHVRDELQGDGTSGLYRLSRSDIVLNSERVRIETRERFHSEQIVESRDLVRHIDYDIDYDNGTLFFREPIAGRDFDLNPNWIVVDYETSGASEEFLNAGGRASVHLLDDRLEAGATYVSDQDARGRSQLFGVDANFRLSETDQFRAEAAATRGDGMADGTDAGERFSGNAWLLEWRHQSSQLAFLAYARRQAGAFGLGQQNASEAGTFKVGVEGQYTLTPQWSLRADINRVEDLATGAKGDMLSAEVVYRTDSWGARAGLRWARDTSAEGEVQESRLMTLGADKFLLDRRLQVSADAEFALGGSNDSIDYPTRLRLGANYAINEAFKLVLSQEFTDGEERDTATTRFGFDVTPWANARLTSTLNQSRISEYGPRTFAVFGLHQRFLFGQRWGFDVALDSSQAFNDAGQGALVTDPSQPIRAGGLRDGGALTSDYVALSGGVTYRAELWSWNARLEGRQGNEDRYGFTTALLRQISDGVALSATMQAFSQYNSDGSSGLLANAELSWAYRPLGSGWSMLDKLEFRLDQVDGGNGASIIGQDTLAVSGDARSRRLVNNFVLNYAATAWGDEDTRGVLDLDQRSQFSVYYGSKYVLDSFGPDDYAGYTDILGAEWRLDISPRIDIGLRASVLHSWSQKTFAWAIGPSVGFTPFTNAWVSVGYNIRGFEDRDFGEAHHTAEGLYLVLRMKFDQQSLGLGGDGS